LLLQLKDATIGNLRHSRSDLLDPFSPYLLNKELASTIAYNNLCITVLGLLVWPKRTKKTFPNSLRLAKRRVQ
jgi:hypothetical protein